MALTITNHLTAVRMPRTVPGFGDGGGIVIRLPGRVLTGGRAAAIEAAGRPAGSQLIATRRCTTKGSGPV